MHVGKPNAAAAAELSRHWTDRTDRCRLTHFARCATAAERRREQALADWYGADRAMAEIAVHRSPARPVGELLDGVLHGLGMADAVVLERVSTVWPDLVGADVARRASPVGLRGRVLTVEVRSPTWLYVLQREHRDEVCARLRAATAGDVTDVRFVPPGRLPRRPG